jgi:hypothetical protein
VFEIGSAKGFFSGAGEDDVGDGKVADRPLQSGNIGNDLASDASGGFANFFPRAVFADDGRECATAVEHHRVVADLRCPVSSHREGYDDEGVAVCDEEAACLEVGDEALEVSDGVAQGGLAFGSGVGRVEFVTALFEQFAVARDGGVFGCAAAARPAVVGDGLEAWRGGVVFERAFGVGAVGYHIHVGLNEEDFAPCARMGDFEYGVAVVKIVPGDERAEDTKVLPIDFDFFLVKGFKKA